MNAAPAVCYPDFETKRRAYPELVIPAIFAMAAGLGGADQWALLDWLRGGLDRSRPHGPGQLESLHDLARNGTYRPAKQPCDVLQGVGVTIQQGAPCSGWAVVLGAALKVLGYPWRLATAGDDADPYRHVYVQAWHAGRWYTLDAKGSQAGQDFDVDAAPERYDVIRYWEASQ